MTVPDQTPQNVHTANGATTTFAYQFKILDTDHLEVYLDDVLQTSGYSVTGEGVNAGGTVVFTTAPANGTEVILMRSMTIERTAYDYQNAGDFLAATVNEDFDAAIMIAQQINNKVDQRALLFPATLDRTNNTNALPEPEEGRVLYWASGEIQNGLLNSLANEVTFASELVTYDTMAQAIADTDLTVTKKLLVKDRANSTWDLASSGTADGYRVVYLTASGLYATLRNDVICIDAAWGAKDNTDNTLCTQAMVTYAEANDLGVFLCPFATGTILEKINILTGGITIAGYKSKVLHKYSSVVQGSGGAGSTKAWPVFMIYRDADNVEITNLDFRADSSIATVQASLSADWLSYLAHICIHNADNVHIHNCRFAGTQPRAIFAHGGNYQNIHDNVFVGQGLILHVGHAQNQNFWDSGANDQTTWFSPQAPSIRDNTFTGYVGASGYHVIFMSGTVDHTVERNKILAMNQSGADAIRIYTNDLGITNISGTPVLNQGGTVKDNVVRGTFAYGLRIDGYSTSATSQVHKVNQDVEHNDIQGTGGGIFLERFNGSKVQKNIVKTTGSPLLMTRDISNTQINNSNWFECTSAGTSTVTLWTGTTLDLQSTQIDDNDIISPAGDQRAIYATAGNFDNSSVSKNRFQFNSTVASPTVIAITVADGTLDLEDNEFTIASSTMANRPLHDIAGTAKVSYKRNKVVSSTVQLGTMEIASASCDALENTNHPALTLTVTDRAVVADNDITQSTTGTGRTLTISGAAWADVHDNRITATAALGVSLIMFSSCTESRLMNNRLVGNTSVPLVRVDTSGDCKYWGNEQTNNGAGGTTYTTSGTATAAAMTGT